MPEKEDPAMSLAHTVQVVISEDVDRSQLPKWGVLYVMLVRRLQDDIDFEALEAKLRVRRRGGSYTGLDIVLFLLAYYCCAFIEGGKPKGGLRAFSRRCGAHKDQLAAVAGRERWPTSSSVSRFLKAVGKDNVAEFMHWALGEHSVELEMITDEQVVWKDSLGCPLHVIDWDPRAHMLRQRALAESDERPEPVRRSDGIAEPGRGGRKRGQVRSTRGLLVHEGAAKVIASYLQRGNGRMSQAIETVELALARWWQSTGVDAARTLVRIDGEGDAVALLNSLVRLGAQVLVRLTRYDILKTDEAKRRLREGPWVDVPDCHSGPKRQALDLGFVYLKATDVPDGRADLSAPIKVRVVVSRFQADQKRSSSQTGLTIGPYHYEMYATGLDHQPWAPEQIVRLYYARACVENRFNQQDADIYLQTTFSDAPQGQHLAQLVGLWCWNLLLTMAWRLRKSEIAPPPQDEHPVDRQRLNEPGAADDEQLAQTQPKQVSLPQKTRARLEGLGMRYDLATHSLICKAGGYLPVSRIREDSGRQYHEFRAADGACKGCPMRDQCMRSSNENYRKQVWIGADEFDAAGIEVTGLHGRGLLKPPKQAVRPLVVRRPQTRAGQWLERLRQACHDSQVSVAVEKPTPAHAWRSATEWHEINRSRLRYTWRMRYLHNALPEDATVKIHWRTRGDLKKLITTASATP